LLPLRMARVTNNISDEYTMPAVDGLKDPADWAKAGNKAVFDELRRVIHPERASENDGVNATLSGNEKDNATVDDADAHGRSKFSFVSAASLMQSIKPNDWLIKGVVERDSLTMVFGDPESGKSLLVKDMALSVAAGIKWRGLRTVHGAVFYVCGEGHNGLGRRLSAWSMQNGVDVSGIPFFCSTIPAQLTLADSALEVERAIRELAAIHGTPAMIVVDTLARNFGPGDENNAKDVGRFVAHLDMFLRAPFGAAVVFAHHTGHTSKDRAKGSIAIPGAIDANYRVTKDGSDIRMESCKAKDFARPDPMQFKLVIHGLGMVDEDGDTVTGATVSPCQYEAQKGLVKSGLSKQQQACLSILDEWYSEVKRTLGDQGRDGNPVMLPIIGWQAKCRDWFIGQGGAAGAAQKAAKRATDALVAKHGVVTRRDDGIHVYPSHREGDDDE